MERENTALRASNVDLKWDDLSVPYSPVTHALCLVKQTSGDSQRDAVIRLIHCLEWTPLLQVLPSIMKVETTRLIEALARMITQNTQKLMNVWDDTYDARTELTNIIIALLPLSQHIELKTDNYIDADYFMQILEARDK